MTLKVEVHVDAVHVHIHTADEEVIIQKLNKAASDLDKKTEVLKTAVEETNQ